MYSKSSLISILIDYVSLQANELLKRDERLFYFIFPIVLFSSNDKIQKEIKDVVDAYAEHFKQLLTKYLIFTSSDDNEYAVTTSGEVAEIVSHLKYWNDS